jgi:uncharacterized protein
MNSTSERAPVNVLSHHECLRMLSSVRLGRIALTNRALPLILPVAFATMDGQIVFRVGHGVISKAADMQQVVCFEADWADHALASAWSVTAIGQLVILCDPAALERVGQLDLVPWTEDCDKFVALDPQLLSGRSRSA